jgi:pyrroloquinoline quinone biosynthesis protein B
VKPVLVPHRAEFSDTCAFEVSCDAETLFYCPDIDSWAKWDQVMNLYARGKFSRRLGTK